MNNSTGKRADPCADTAGNGADSSRTVFLFSLSMLCALLLFLAGVWFANVKLWPYRPIERAWSVLSDAHELGAFAPKHALNPAPANSAREPWVVHDRAGLLPGYRALTGYLPEAGEFGVWVFDGAGQIVHQRRLNYASLDPDGPSGGSESPHAFLFLPDGSVIVNVDKGDAIARYDTCGNPLWSREGAYHHSLDVDPEGGIWTWQGEVSTFDQYHSLVRFDPETGDTLERIDLFAGIINQSAQSRMVFSLVPGQELEHYRGPRAIADLFHPNDLEVLKPTMAGAFKAFQAGDLLMSFRNIDLVAVVDRKTLAIKWWRHGPWRRQHDPDFLPDGRISVFNNNPARPSSNIVILDPATDEIELLDIEPDFRFYTLFMGKHEWVDDSIVQITVPYEGRVLEVDRSGQVLLEINNPLNEHTNAFVSDAAYLPTGFFDVAPKDWVCNQSDSRT